MNALELSTSLLLLWTLLSFLVKSRCLSWSLTMLCFLIELLILIVFYFTSSMNSWLMRSNLCELIFNKCLPHKFLWLFFSWISLSILFGRILTLFLSWIKQIHVFYLFLSWLISRMTILYELLLILILRYCNSTSLRLRQLLYLLLRVLLLKFLIKCMLFRSIIFLLHISI
jgi:hypothetical protein